MSWRGSIAGLIVALVSASASAATVNDGRTAYMQGDYARAFQLLEPLADKGDPDAAYIIGRQYQLGQGVARDLGRAWYWYRRAEAKGNVEAGLFRQLLISKWKISAADRARGEAMFAAYRSARRTDLARVTMRPSPRPTPAVARPSSIPNTVTVGKLPTVTVQPLPMPAVNRTTPNTTRRAPPPTVAAGPETCIGCRSTKPNLPDTEPRLAERNPQTSRQPRDDRAAGTVGTGPAIRQPGDTQWNEPEDPAFPVTRTPPRPVWRRAPAYMPPAVALYPGYRYWRYRAWQRRRWRRGPWRYGPGPRFVRPWRYRRWRDD